MFLIQSLVVLHDGPRRVLRPIPFATADVLRAVAERLVHGEFECRLPNAFLADPPLDDVVARSFELGSRGFDVAEETADLTRNSIRASTSPNRSNPFSARGG